MSSISSTKRLAKNTMMMYIRMGITMIASLITARVVLQTLGVEDYGLYNAVSGFVVLMTFLNNALNLTSQRYFSYTIGENDAQKLQDVFNSTFIIYLFVAAIIFLLGETVGNWFVYSQMVFPEGKKPLALYVYQFSLLITCLNVVRTPFTALIIASEKLDFYATSAIIESSLHLLLVFLLLVVPFNPSYIYILFQTLLSLFMVALFYIYYKRHYSDTIHFAKVKNKKLYRELISFSGWGVFGSVATIGYQQGINILLNLFFGVTVNAAFGIANRINSMVNQFFTGFQTAANPQITKAQAVGNVQDQLRLINNTSKISFFLLMFVGVAVIYNLDFLLIIWLKDVPENTSLLCRLMIIGAMVDALSSPLYVTIFATGRIRSYQVTISTVLLMNIVFSYLAYRFGSPVQTCMYIRIILFGVGYVVRLYFVRKYTSINIMKIVREVIFRVAVISAIIGLIVSVLQGVSEPLIRLFIITPALLIIMAIIMFYLGFNHDEQKMIAAKVLSILKKRI